MTDRSGKNEDARMSEVRAALRVAVPMEDATRVEQRRSHLLDVLAKEIERVPKDLARREARLKLQGVLKWGAVAATVLALFGGGVHRLLMTGHEEREHSRAVEPGAPLERSPYVGKILETHEGEEEKVVLAGKTELRLKSETRLRIAEDTYSEQVFQLGLGHVRVSVPPGDGARSVRVVTPHATISVKGTLFSVDLAQVEGGDPEPRTRVSVEHGRVLVEHPAGVESLTAGQTWISPNRQEAALEDKASKERVSTARQLQLDTANLGAQTETAAPTQQSLAQKETPERSPIRAGEASDARTPPILTEESSNTAGESSRSDSTTRSENGTRNDDVQESTLSQQNALLEAALLAEKRGDAARARHLVDRLLEKYPRSPLRASAQAVKKRLE